MKLSFNKIFFAAIAASCLFAACTKDSEKVVFNGGTAPVLTASTDTLPLNAADSLNPLVTFSWTNPDYQFSDGISSQDVTYGLQIDTLGANFSSSIMQTVTPNPAYDLDTTFTVSKFNAMLGNGMLLKTGQPHQIQVRIVAAIANSSQTQLVSNSFTYTVTPYAPPPKVMPPSTGVLYLQGGDPLLGAWSIPVPAANKFTQVSPTDYQLTIALSGGDPTNSNSSDQYLLLGDNTDYNIKYACVNTSTQPTSGGSFGIGGSYTANFPGPTAAGTYLFDVNFQTGIITLTKQ